jgi:hypothetical protein
MHHRDYLILGAVISTLIMPQSSDALGRPHNHGTALEAAPLQIPASIRAEHEELHAHLAEISALPGKTGEAAKGVAAALHPHFLAEEELAMPPLGTLGPLADGRTVDARAVVALTNRLRSEMPKMLDDHKAIARALDILAEAARAENQPRASGFAEALHRHARLEEEVLYPAALLVGTHLKARR